MNNPFEVIEARLSNIESLLLDLKHQPKQTSVTNFNERITRKQLSKEKNISLGTIHNLMKEDNLPFEKIGRKTLFKREDVERFFSNKKKGGKL